MKLKACARQAVLYAAAGVIVLISAAGCARTISGRSLITEQTGRFYSSTASEKEQAAYFEKVKSHFQKIGRPLNEGEEKRYTASIFIITIPASADIYIGSDYIGSANSGPLYFVPGKHELVFNKAGKQSRKTLDLVEGKNLSVVVKL
jgi:hypothetical protein